MLPNGTMITEIEYIYDEIANSFGHTLFICTDKYDNYYLCGLYGSTYNPDNDGKTYLELNYIIGKLNDKDLVQAIYRKIDLKTLYNSCSEKYTCQRIGRTEDFITYDAISVDKFDDDILPVIGEYLFDLN
jgi:hypothetical protein